MTAKNRIKTEDFVVRGKDLLEESTSIHILDNEQTYCVTKGNGSLFFGMDKYLAALMLKHGINEIELTEDDLRKVDTFSINWHGDGEKTVSLTANRLPISTDKEMVPILQYSTGYSYDQTEKKYWDFYKPSVADKGVAYMLLVPNNIIEDQRIEYITSIMRKKDGREYRPFYQTTDVIELSNDIAFSNTNETSLLAKIMRCIGIDVQR